MSFLTKNLFAFALFLVIIFPGCAQDKSSLEWYNQFFSTDKPVSVEKALARANHNLQEASEQNDPLAHARALNEAGLTHLTRTHDYEQAMDYLIQALTLEDSLSLKEQQLFTCLGIARVFEAVGNEDKSAQFLEQALSINENLKDVSLMVLILNELGKVNASRGKTDDAFANYEQVLEHREEILPAIEGEVLFNLAHLYTQQGRYKEALSRHKNALAIRRSTHDKPNEALSLNDIAEVYRLMNNDDKALANHLVALEIRKKRDDKSGMASSYNAIGALYLENKNLQRAADNLQLALTAGQETQSQDNIRRSYDLLYQTYKAAGDYKKALEAKELFTAIHDFIQNERNEQQLLETQNRYVIDKKELQIDKLETDRARQEQEFEAQKRFRNILILSVALAVVVLALITYLYVIKRRSNLQISLQNDALQELNATKDKFFSIISHDLKGPLNSLTSFSGLLINHTESLSKEEIKMLAQDLDKSLKNLFALLENLLEWSRSQTGSIEFTPEPFDLSAVLDENRVLLTAQAGAKEITIENKSHVPVMVRAHKNSVNTVVRNLLSNAIKFTGNGGRVTLDVTASGNDYRVSVTDTGVGMPPEVIEKLFRIDTKHSTKGTANEKGTGLGLILCREFIEKNGGRIGVESVINQGSVFYFTLPYSGPVDNQA